MVARNGGRTGPRCTVILAAMPEPQTIPVWIEAIVPLTVTPDEGPDGDDDWSVVDLTDAARSALPANADLVTACTVEHVEHVMDQEAADIRAALAEARRQLTVAIGAWEHGLADNGELVASLRNIRAALPAYEPRSAEVARRIDAAADPT